MITFKQLPISQNSSKKRLSQLLQDQSQMFGLNRREIQNQVFKQPLNRPITAKIKPISNRGSSQTFTQTQKLSPYHGGNNYTQQHIQQGDYGNATLITALPRPKTQEQAVINTTTLTRPQTTGPKRLNVKTARMSNSTGFFSKTRNSSSQRRYNQQRQPYPKHNLMDQMINITHQQEMLKEYGTYIDQSKVKRHPSIVDKNIQTVPYKLMFNNLFKPNNTRFSIFSSSNSIREDKLGSTSRDQPSATNRSLPLNQASETIVSHKTAIDTIRDLKRQKSGKQIVKSNSNQQQNQIQPEEAKMLGFSSKNFINMSINQLKKHEKGILNMYEDQKKKQKSHNKNQENKMFDVRLTKQEYESIFDQPPSFYEKRAFIQIFRKKWREDNGHCSLFDRRGYYKQARESNLKTTRMSEAIQRYRNENNVVASLNTTFTNGFNNTRTFQIKPTNLNQSAFAAYSDSRTGYPTNGLRRSQKPNLAGKNFTLSGQMLAISSRPNQSQIRTTKYNQKPRNKYQSAILNKSNPNTKLSVHNFPGIQKEKYPNSSNSIIAGRHSSIAQSQTQNNSQMNTFNQSENVVSPIAAGVRGGIKDSNNPNQAKIYIPKNMALSKTNDDVRESIESINIQQQQSQKAKRRNQNSIATRSGSFQSKQSKSLRNSNDTIGRIVQQQKRIGEIEQNVEPQYTVEVKNAYYKPDKSLVAQKISLNNGHDNIGPEQISQLSGGSSFTNYPFLQNPDISTKDNKNIQEKQWKTGVNKDLKSANRTSIKLTKNKQQQSQL